MCIRDRSVICVLVIVPDSSLKLVAPCADTYAEPFHLRSVLVLVLKTVSVLLLDGTLVTRLTGSMLLANLATLRAPSTMSDVVT